MRRGARYNQAGNRAAIGTHTLEPGIYLIVSKDGLAVTVHSTGIQVIANDKDPWPSPKAKLIGLEPGASAESISEFFTVAMDLDVDD